MTEADHIYLACGHTDFRKQIDGLVTLVTMKYKLDPYMGRCIFIFCNKSKTAIKVLRYDKNGFILATKKLLEGMKFQWPKKENDIRDISYQQIEWLLEGLSIDQKQAHWEVKIKAKESCY